MRNTRALLMVGIVVTAIVGSACSTASETCDCADNTVQIHIPQDLAAAAMKPALSGACAGIDPTCTEQAASGGCALYGFAPNKIGPDCHIEIDFSTGKVFTADLKIVQETGCCAGFYAEPISAADIEVPEGA